jgi:hypothetical protein
MNGIAGQEVENETAAQKALNETTRQGTGTATQRRQLAVRVSVPVLFDFRICRGIHQAD